MANDPLVPVVSSAAESSAAVVSATDVINLLYSSSQSSSNNPLEVLSLSALSPDEFRRLEDLLMQHGENLSEDDKRSLRQGKDQEVAALLRQIQKRLVERGQIQHVVARERDGITQHTIHYAAPETGRQKEHLPAGDIPEAQMPAPLAKEQSQNKKNSQSPPTDKPVAELQNPPVVGDANPEGGAPPPGDLMQVRPPLHNGQELERKKLQLLHLVVQPQSADSVVPLLDEAKNPVSKLPFDPLPPANTKVTRVILGEQRVRNRYVNNFPEGGHSGQSHRLPLLQFSPPALKPTFEALGINNLSEFLVRTLSPEGRRILAEALGLPRPALLLASLRAELLDLPIDKERGASPHLKDVLLLARLGINGVPGLEALAQALHDKPLALEILADLIALVQKKNPIWQGRQRLTKHELKLWLLAAQKRGSDLQIPAANRSPLTVSREPSAADRSPLAVSREPSAADRSPLAVSREPSTANRSPLAVSREPSTANRSPLAVSRESSTANRSPVTVSQEPSAANRSPLAVSREPSTADRSPLAVNREPSTAVSPREQWNQAGEEILHWYLQQKNKNPSLVFKECLSRLCEWLGKCKLPLDESLLKRIEEQSDAETAALSRRLWQDELKRRDEGRLEKNREEERFLAAEQETQRRQVQHHQEDYANYILQGAEWSLFFNLAPWMRPDLKRKDGRLCFFMQPAPDFSNLEQNDAQHSAVRPVYVCLDPESGAISPFDAGG